MSICMPVVPRRFDLNSYPSFKPYVMILPTNPMIFFICATCMFGSKKLPWWRCSEGEGMKWWLRLGADLFNLSLSSIIGWPEGETEEEAMVGKGTLWR